MGEVEEARGYNPKDADYALRNNIASVKGFGDILYFSDQDKVTDSVIRNKNLEDGLGRESE